MKYLQVTELGIYILLSTDICFLLNTTYLIKRLVHMYSILSLFFNDIVVSVGVSSYYIAHEFFDALPVHQFQVNKILSVLVYFSVSVAHRGQEMNGERF